MKIAVLGPGGVGGLVAGALARVGVAVSLVGRPSAVEVIAREGLRVQSVLLGSFTVQPEVVAHLGGDAPEALIVATKAVGLEQALERIQAQPKLVLPLLNGLDHLTLLRERFGEETVVAGTIRVESDRPEPGVIVHTSRFLRVDMASRFARPRGEACTEGSGAGCVGVLARVEWLARALSDAGVPARVHPSDRHDDIPSGASEGGEVRDWEAQVMWSKLVRLNALACTTSAHDLLLGEIRSTPELRAELIAAIEEGCAVARAEGAVLDSEEPLGELAGAHDTLGSSMQRDIAAGRTPELDAIPGSVLRAAARHGIACPTIEGLVEAIAARAGVARPVVP
jgi:2-dehydropantoate 2-reductase